MQCVNWRLISSGCFEKHEVGEKILWKCSEKATSRDILMPEKRLKSE